MLPTPPRIMAHPSPNCSPSHQPMAPKTLTPMKMNIFTASSRARGTPDSHRALPQDGWVVSANAKRYLSVALQMQRAFRNFANLGGAAGNLVAALRGFEQERLPI